ARVDDLCAATRVGDQRIPTLSPNQCPARPRERLECAALNGNMAAEIKEHREVGRLKELERLATDRRRNPPGEGREGLELRLEPREDRATGNGDENHRRADERVERAPRASYRRGD